MVWELHHETSKAGESPGQSSIIGFRGSLFSVDRTGVVSIPDYARQKEPHSRPGNYASQIRDVLHQGAWSGRLRIRYGGDTYCVDPNSGTGWTYVGRTELGSVEPFEGYVLGAAKNLPLAPPHPSLYSGPHNHGSVGERWTIPDSGWALTQGAFGSVGIKISKGDWAWSRSEHPGFIENMKRMFPYEDFIRFYITCYGYVVRPVMRKYWGGIDVQGQFNEIVHAAPKSAKSLQHRLNNSRDDPGKSTLYFVCGHVDDIMDGRIPDPDDDDPRTGAINQDQRKWG